MVGRDETWTVIASIDPRKPFTSCPNGLDYVANGSCLLLLCPSHSPHDGQTPSLQHQDAGDLIRSISRRLNAVDAYSLQNGPGHVHCSTISTLEVRDTNGTMFGTYASWLRLRLSVSDFCDRSRCRESNGGEEASDEECELHP